jgi:hypothetical protein
MPEPLDTATDTTDSGVASVAALADDLDYTLTIGQAMERFAAASRAVPSMRSMQRYCAEHHLATKKIRTVFGSEWLINELSLMRLIESERSSLATSATPRVATQRRRRRHTLKNRSLISPSPPTLATPTSPTAPWWQRP